MVIPFAFGGIPLARGAIPAAAQAVVPPAAFVDAHWSVATGSGSRQLAITISTLPSDNGSTITNVQYDVDASDTWISLPSYSGTGTYQVTTEAASTSYAIRLRAVNAGGEGTAGNSESATSSADTSEAFLATISAPSGQRNGSTLSLDESNLTNVTSRQWRAGEVDISGETGSTYTMDVMGDDLMGKNVDCVIECDQGTVTTPGVYTYMNHATASHNADDDAVLALVPHPDATVIAGQSGDWSDSATWNTGSVPGNFDRVLIPAGITVTYDVNATEVRLDWIRVDGTLQTDITATTYCLFETLVGTLGGSFIDGTSSGRVDASVTHEWVISDRNVGLSTSAATNIDFANDGKLLGRAMLWQGLCRMWASDRDRWLKPVAAPVASDTEIAFASQPTGWEVGDRIVISGTSIDVLNNQTPTTTFDREDEERTITDITDNIVTINSGLTYDHDTPIGSRADLVPAVLSRESNIIIRSEDNTVANHRRGHTMFMHGGCTVDVWGVAFVDLGRTDKSFASGVIDGSSLRIPADSGTTTTTLDATSNLQSRYPCHGHFPRLWSRNQAYSH